MLNFLNKLKKKSNEKTMEELLDSVKFAVYCGVDDIYAIKEKETVKYDGDEWKINTVELTGNFDLVLKTDTLNESIEYCYRLLPHKEKGFCAGIMGMIAGYNPFPVILFRVEDETNLDVGLRCLLPATPLSMSVLMHCLKTEDWDEDTKEKLIGE